MPALEFRTEGNEGNEDLLRQGRWRAKKAEPITH